MNHHYIPQCYLGNFSDENSNIHVLNKEYGNIKGFKSSQIMYGKVLYDVYYMNEHFQGLEKYFKFFEDRMPYILNSVKNMAMEKNGVNRDDKKKLAFFAAIQYCRNPHAEIPSMIEICKNLVNYHKNLKKFPFKLLLPDIRKKHLKMISDAIKLSVKMYGEEETMPLVWMARIYFFPYILFNYENSNNITVIFNANEKVSPLITNDNPVMVKSFDLFRGFRWFYYPLFNNLAIIQGIEGRTVEGLNKMAYENGVKRVISGDRSYISKIKNRYFKK
ncbi:DUF4238 domain-containing protein [Proteus mirabilis]|nr:DUF4238 domain-containing protein [Proteus mirabilis]